MAAPWLNGLFGPIVVLGALLANPACAQQAAPVVPRAQKQATPSEAERLAAVACLGSPVTVDVAGMPLSEVLGLLSRPKVVRLIAKTPLGDQRVTLHVNGLPLHHVMNRIITLLDHGPRSPGGFYWIDQSQQGEKQFRLERTMRSIAEERRALDFPRRKAAQWLREMRAGKGGDLPKDYLADADFQPFRDALAALSDDQMDALIDTGSAPAAAPSLTEAIAKYNKRWHDGADRRRQDSVRDGLPDPFPGGVPNMPPDPPTMTFGVDDYKLEHPERAHLFGLYLKGVALIDNGEFHLAFDPLESLDIPDPDPTSGAESPQFDLGPLLHARGVTDVQRGDSGFALQALGRVAGLELYEEHFLKTGYWGARPKGLRVEKGSLAQLVHGICKEWGLNCRRTGTGYLFWSRTWAQDRSTDIPERFLAPRRRRLAEAGAVTLADRIDLAGAFTWPQLRLTLELALPEAGPWNARSEAAGLRLLAMMADDQRRAALSATGIGLAQLSDAQRAFLATDCVGSGSAPGGYDPALLRLSVAIQPPSSADVEQSGRLQLSAGEREIWGTVLLVHRAVDKTTIAP
jgi:hypothetical protein